MRHKYVLRGSNKTTKANPETIATTKTDGIIEGITTVTAETQEEATSEIEIQIVETQEEATSEIEIQTVETQEEATLEIEIQIVETQEEATSEIEIQIVETQEETTSEIEIQETGQAAEKKRSLLIMIGHVQNVTILIFRLEKNVIAVVSRKVAIPKEETTEEGETNRQEMTGEVGMIASQENSEKPEVNHPITHITGVQNHSMLVHEEEIAMIK